MKAAESFVRFVRELYGTNEFIPLHEPRFLGKEREYVLETIDSTFVSSAGKFVNEFEERISQYVGSRYAIATVNGTSALHAGLHLVGVSKDDLVITQAFTFVATCNAIEYCGATPVFVDIDRDTLGLSSRSLKEFLEAEAIVESGKCVHKRSGRTIRACVPMHTFGHAARINEIKKICDQYRICLVEDSAEAIGSTFEGQSLGTFGQLGIISFNGNKVITTGGGGIIITDNDELANKAKHVTTTAKLSHPWHYEHDVLGFNYRMPNINAALGCAQLEQMDGFLKAKRSLASQYHEWCCNNDLGFIQEPKGSYSNYWLNAIVTENKAERDAFLEYTNKNKVMTRPVWIPMHKLDMFSDCYRWHLENTEYLADRLINVPSSVITDVG